MPEDVCFRSVACDRKLRRTAMVPLLTTPVLLAQKWGGPTNYQVQRGDSISSIGARLGIDVKVLGELNDLKPAQRPAPGSELKIDNSHIVSYQPDVDILI